MVLKIKNNPIDYFIEVFQQKWNIDIIVDFSVDPQCLNGNLGCTIFPKNEEETPEIWLNFYNKDLSQFFDIFAHELTHVLAGAEHEHDDIFQNYYNKIHENYTVSFEHDLLIEWRNE